MKKINKISLAVILVMLCFTSCKNNDAVDKITKERDSLLVVTTEKDSSIVKFANVLGEIENHLLDIRRKEAVLTLRVKNGEQLKGDVTEEINENIKAINLLMEYSALKIGDLNSRLKASNFKVKELGVVVDALTATLNDKNKDLKELNTLLLAKNKLIVELGGTTLALAHQNYKDGETIAKQEQKLNTAYYIFATHQQLKDKNIITKEGKLSDMFIGEQLNTNLNVGYFKEIDIKQKTHIPAGWRMETKTIKFYTAHPDDSYTLVKDKKGMITNIDITNPENFWKISKLLVIEVDK